MDDVFHKGLNEYSEDSWKQFLSMNDTVFDAITGFRITGIVLIHYT